MPTMARLCSSSKDLSTRTRRAALYNENARKVLDRRSEFVIPKMLSDGLSPRNANLTSDVIRKSSGPDCWPEAHADSNFQQMKPTYCEKNSVIAMTWMSPHRSTQQIQVLTCRCLGSAEPTEHHALPYDPRSFTFCFSSQFQTPLWKTMLIHPLIRGIRHERINKPRRPSLDLLSED